MQVKIRRRYLAAPTILWTALIAYLLLTPNPGVGGTKYFEGQDKVAHTILFMVWSFLIYLWRSRTDVFDWKVAIYVLIMSVSLAFITEWIQEFVPNRSSDILDFYCDLTGAVIGVLLGFFGKKELMRAGKKFYK